MLCSITDFIETDPWRDTDQFINRSSIQRMLNQETNPNCCFGWALRSSGRENKSLRKSRESPESWSSSGKESPFASKRRHTSSMNWKNGLECLSQSGRDNECTKNLRNLQHKLLSKAQRHHFPFHLTKLACSARQVLRSSWIPWNPPLQATLNSSTRDDCNEVKKSILKKQFPRLLLFSNN